jgi:hypothetical protein
MFWGVTRDGSSVTRMAGQVDTKGTSPGTFLPLHSGTNRISVTLLRAFGRLSLPARKLPLLFDLPWRAA